MKRVLIIDDDAGVRATVSVLLTSKGFEVVTAESGFAGLAIFESSLFDLVIVDIYMPGQDGAKTIKKLRERTPNLAIIAISGKLLNATGRTALDFFGMAPAFANVVCLQKPFRPDQLLQAVHNAIYVAQLQSAQ